MEISGRLYKYGRWAGWVLVILAIAGILYWGDFFTRTRDIKIATGEKNSYYYQFGKTIKYHIEKNSNFTVSLQITKGSVENSSRILAGEADIAIVQGDAVSLENLEVISPLWEEAFSIVVRKNAGIESPKDLRLKSLSLGKHGSDTRISALKVLKHYAIDPETLGSNDFEATDMLRDPALDAAIVISNLENPELKLLMESNRFVWLSLAEAEGIALFHPFLKPTTIPKGLYTTFASPVPENEVKTAATHALLVTRKDMPYEVVEAVLKTLYSSEVRLAVPILLDKQVVELKPWNLLRYHPAASTYYNPYGGLVLLSDFLGKIDRFKYVIILVIIVLVIAINKWRTRSFSKKEKQFALESGNLKSWLSEIVRIDQEQKKAKDSRLLKNYLNEALTVKRKAMDDTKDESVLHSTFYQTFLNECSFVINEIEWRLNRYQESEKTE